ncbi:MAG: protein arginine kinase [Candidatus Omnitrophica bacterium]|nr:protein arginine kinase [Candidatus Omnitrophota bacterium]
MKEINDLIGKKSEWLKGQGPHSDIAISTRIRIARNIKGHVYFYSADDEARRASLDRVTEAMRKSRYFNKALFISIRDLEEVDRYFLIERHLMSREHLEDAEHKGLVVGNDEAVSAMINEEDHIRLQVMRSGSDLTDAWKLIDEIDTELSSFLKYDYSTRFGYLTSCPTNTGTGMRASVMLHLAALVMTRQIEKVFDAISKLGLTMRGFYGEGTAAIGDFFQISNQQTLGYSESDIIDNLQRVIAKIIKKEKETREQLIENQKEVVTDRVHRSYGTLKSARIITSAEAVKLLSAVRLGADLGLLDGIVPFDMNELLLSMQPAHLQKMEGKLLQSQDRDIRRADLIRDKLGVDSGR